MLLKPFFELLPQTYNILPPLGILLNTMSLLLYICQKVYIEEIILDVVKNMPLYWSLFSQTLQHMNPDR